MFRRTFLQIVWLLLVTSTYKNGCIINIIHCSYSYYLGSPEWKIYCEYNIDDAEIRRIFIEGDDKDEKKIRIPGTSAELYFDTEKMDFYDTHSVDVREVKYAQ